MKPSLPAEQAPTYTTPQHQWYAYYSLLRSLLASGGGMRNLRKFRYKSIAEAELWGKAIDRMAKPKQVLFYAMVHELRGILREDNVPLVGSDSPLVFSGWTLPLLTLGFYWSQLLRDDLEMEMAEIEGGKAFVAFMNHIGDEADKVRGELYWGGEISVEDRLAGIARVYARSGFLKSIRRFVKETVAKSKPLEKDGILNRFVSPFEMLEDAVIGYVPKQVEMAPGKMNAEVLFVGEFPLWINPVGQGSFFTYTFRNLLSDSHKGFVTMIEHMKLLGYAEPARIRTLEKSSIVHLGKRMVERNVANGQNWGESGNLVSSLLAGRDANRIAEIIAFTLAEDTMDSSEMTIAMIVREELSLAYREFEKMMDEDRYDDEGAAEIIRLFFINVFERIHREYDEETPIFIGMEIGESKRKELAKRLADQINRILDERENKEGWL